MKNKNPEKELNYKQHKTLFESLKKKPTKNYYSDLINSYKYNIKNVKCLERNAPLPNFMTVKNREMFDKKEIAETFNSYLLISVPT